MISSASNKDDVLEWMGLYCIWIILPMNIVLAYKTCNALEKKGEAIVYTLLLRYKIGT